MSLTEDQFCDDADTRMLIFATLEVEKSLELNSNATNIDNSSSNSNLELRTLEPISDSSEELSEKSEKISQDVEIVHPTLHLEDDKTWTLYVLYSTTEKKYYVGITKHLESRVLKHFNGGGANWTKKNTFDKVCETIFPVDQDDEDKYVIRLMKQVGIKKVRGGTFSNVILTKAQKEILRSYMRSSNNDCFLCGSSDHMGHECPQKQSNDNTVKKNSERNEPIRCFHCDEIGHIRPKCPNLGKDRCYLCKEWGHRRPECPNKKEDPKKLFCQDCGKFGHKQPQCPNKKPAIDYTDYVCDNCNEKGHSSYLCPNLICENCKEKGHRSTECPTRGKKRRLQ